MGFSGVRVWKVKATCYGNSLICNAKLKTKKKQEAAKEVSLIGEDYFPKGTTSKYKR